MCEKKLAKFWSKNGPPDSFQLKIEKLTPNLEISIDKNFNFEASQKRLQVVPKFFDQTKTHF